MSTQLDPADAARFALSVLTMRVDSPAGDWLASDYEQIYLDRWAELHAEHGDEADEDVFLNLLNIAEYLLGRLVEATGREPAYWLTEVRRDYVDTMDA